MDYIFIIIDPQPYLIAKEIDRVMNFVKLKQEGHPIYFIFNKMNKGVDGKGLCNSLGLEGVINIPHIDPVITYNCLYDGRIPFEHKDIDEEFVDSMDIIIKEIIGNKYYKKERKTSLFNRIFKK